MKRRMKKMTSLALASILAVSFPFAGRKLVRLYMCRKRRILERGGVK